MKHNIALIAPSNTTGKLASELRDELSLLTKPSIHSPNNITKHQIFGTMDTPDTYARRAGTEWSPLRANGNGINMNDVVTAIANSHTVGIPNIRKLNAQAQMLEDMAKALRGSTELFIKAQTDINEWNALKHDRQTLVNAIDTQARHETSVTQTDLSIGEMQMNEQKRDAEMVQLRKDNASLTSKFKSFMKGA
jgi:hypothetical protein